MRGLGWVYRRIKKITKSVSKIEKKIKIALFFIVPAILLLQILFPFKFGTLFRLAAASLNVEILLDVFKGLIPFLIISLLILKYTLTRNPAQSVSIKALEKKFPQLWKDIESLVLLNQVKFSSKQLEIVDTTASLYMVSFYNSKLFEDSANYSGDVIKKLNRNKSIFAKYKKCFAFVCDDFGKTVGISIVVPLNSRAADLYKKGKLSDHDICDIHVASRSDRCGAVLLFAIGLISDLQAKANNSLKRKHIRHLIRAHVLHAYKVGSDFGIDNIKYIVQSERASISSLLKQFGFIKLANKGSENDDLYEISWGGISDKYFSYQHKNSKNTKSFSK